MDRCMKLSWEKKRTLVKDDNESQYSLDKCTLRVVQRISQVPLNFFSMAYSGVYFTVIGVWITQTVRLNWIQEKGVKYRSITVLKYFGK